MQNCMFDIFWARVQEGLGVTYYYLGIHVRQGFDYKRVAAMLGRYA